MSQVSAAVKDQGRKRKLDGISDAVCELQIKGWPLRALAESGGVSTVGVATVTSSSPL